MTPARAHAAVQRMRRRCGGHRGWSVALPVTAVLLAACGSTAPTTTTAKATPKSSTSATPQEAGSQRTVLSPLGLNVHSDPAQNAPVVATAAQGVTLTVLDHRSDNGGWYKVQGQSTTGWIVADPSLTAAGVYQSYSSSERGFSALIPNTWTFAEEPADVVFRPQQGEQSIVVRTAANSAALGQQAPSGYVAMSSQTEVVCGYTGLMSLYRRGAGTAAPAQTPSPSASSSSRRLADYAAIRLVFDASHTMEIAYNYASQDQLGVFKNFYNSITFPFPQCQAPAPSAGPAPPA